MRHYGCTAEELDFIINYDIKYLKYRMGDDLFEDEEGESRVNKDYQQIVATLNTLTSAKLVAVLERVPACLKPHIGTYAEEVTDENEGFDRRILGYTRRELA